MHESQERAARRRRAADATTEHDSDAEPAPHPLVALGHQVGNAQVERMLAQREGDAAPCFVFGLPGNPVSSMVCFELFARTALRKRMGDPHPEPQPVSARLTHDFTHKGSRPTYHPATLEFTPRGPEVATVPWVGSADLCATVAANAMAVFPAGDAVHAGGTMLDVIPW